MRQVISDDRSNPLDRMTPVDRNRLIQGYARMYYSKLHHAPKAAKAKLEQEWTEVLTELVHQKLGIVACQTFWQILEVRAHAWWNAKAYKGTGTDW